MRKPVLAQGVAVKPVLKTASQSLSSQQQLQQQLQQEGATGSGDGSSASGGAKLRTTTASGRPLDSVQVR